VKGRAIAKDQRGYRGSSDIKRFLVRWQHTVKKRSPSRLPSSAHNHFSLKIPPALAGRETHHQQLPCTFHQTSTTAATARRHMYSAAPRPAIADSNYSPTAAGSKASHLGHPRPHVSTILPDAAPRGSSLSNSLHSESGDQPERFALAEPMWRRHAGGQLPSRTRLQCRLFTTGLASGRSEPASSRIRTASSPGLAASCGAFRTS